MAGLTGADSGTYDVFLGFWTNWSRGPILGATLTLTKAHGNLLIAFIAIFVGATGRSFWNIACFALHRAFSNPAPQDALYHQRQAILRNVNTAQDAAWALGNGVLMWRGRTRSPARRLVPLIVFAILVSVAFGVAGIFSSQITTDTVNEVLLVGDNCGPLDSSDYTLPDAYVTKFLPHHNQRATSFANYALRCYTNSSTSNDCNLYITPKLPTEVNRDADCPFDEKLCKNPKGNLIVDTGYLDSSEHFGINAPKEDRFSVRMLHHCAPLVTDGFSKLKNDSGVPMMQYFYGELDGAEPGSFTYQMPFSNLTAEDLEGEEHTATAYKDYRLGQIKVYGGNPVHSSFYPIPELDRPEADLMLFFLAADGIRYSKPVDDPWYSAHREGQSFVNYLTNHSTPTYLQDETAGVMGCLMQMQLCNPNLPEAERCNPLRGFADKTVPFYDLWESEEHKEYMAWVYDIIRLGMFSISGISNALGATSLTARYGLSGNTQGPLPDDQWQKEIEHWVDGSLTSIQGSLVEAAAGPPPHMQEFLVPANTTTKAKYCQNQKIISTRYSSFSMLGLGLILGLGTLIMLTDLTLEPLAGRLARRRATRSSDPLRAHPHLEWRANGTLQLQRMAHEQAGVGTWSNAAGANPLTLRSETLAVLDISDEKHPVLRAPGMGVRAFRQPADVEKASTFGSGSSAPATPVGNAGTFEPGSRTPATPVKEDDMFDRRSPTPPMPRPAAEG